MRRLITHVERAEVMPTVPAGALMTMEVERIRTEHADAKRDRDETKRATKRLRWQGRATI
jgi:hypothetical protein